MLLNIIKKTRVSLYLSLRHGQLHHFKHFSTVSEIKYYIYNNLLLSKCTYRYLHEAT